MALQRSHQIHYNLLKCKSPEIRQVFPCSIWPTQVMGEAPACLWDPFEILRRQIDGECLETLVIVFPRSIYLHSEFSQGQKTAKCKVPAQKFDKGHSYRNSEETDRRKMARNPRPRALEITAGQNTCPPPFALGNPPITKGQINAGPCQSVPWPGPVSQSKHEPNLQ